MLLQQQLQLPLSWVYAALQLAAFSCTVIMLVAGTCSMIRNRAISVRTHECVMQYRQQGTMPTKLQAEQQSSRGPVVTCGAACQAVAKGVTNLGSTAQIPLVSTHDSTLYDQRQPSVHQGLQAIPCQPAATPVDDLAALGRAAGQKQEGQGAEEGWDAAAHRPHPNVSAVVATGEPRIKANGQESDLQCPMEYGACQGETPGISPQWEGVLQAAAGNIEASAVPGDPAPDPSASC